MSPEEEKIQQAFQPKSWNEIKTSIDMIMKGKTK